MQELLEELNSIKFPKTRTRKNVSQQSIESFCLGDVNYRGQAFLDYKTRGPSKWNNKFPKLFELCKSIIFHHDPTFEYTTIQLNKNVICKKHVDRNNVGLSYIIGLGDYENGELVVGDNEYDIKNNFLKFDGHIEHYNKEHIGTRYSLIYFTHTFKPPVRLKK